MHYMQQKDLNYWPIVRLSAPQYQRLDRVVVRPRPLPVPCDAQAQTSNYQ